MLVGFVAQLLLGRGQTAVLLAAGRAPPPAGVRLAQALLWNAGVIAVPAGVLSESRLLVVAGSLSLIAALASLCTSIHPALSAAAAPRPWLVWGYSALLVAMLFSVFVGTGQAWDLPWV